MPANNDSAHAEAVNANMRKHLQTIASCSAQLADLAVAAENHRGRIVQRTLSGVDAVALRKFDAGATASVMGLASQMGRADLVDVRGHADAIGGQARAGLGALARWQDHEDLVAQEGVDATTLN